MPAAVAVVATVAGGAAGTAVAGAVATAIGTGMLATVASVAAGVIAGAVVGAIAGGIVGAVTGQDIGDSMKMGAISGGLAGGIGGFGAASSTPASGSGQALSATSGEMGGSPIPDAVAGTEASAGADGMVTAGEIEAGTGNVAMNDATSITIGKTAGLDAVKVTSDIALKNGVSNTGGIISKTGDFIGTAAKKVGNGLMSDKGIAATVQMGGSMLQGMGEADAAKTKAKEAEKAATTAYERSKAKLQDGVDLNTPTYALNNDTWQNSSSNRNSVKAGTPAPAMAPRPTEYRNYKASLDQGLLNA